MGKKFLKWFVVTALGLLITAAITYAIEQYFKNRNEKVLREAIKDSQRKHEDQ